MRYSTFILALVLIPFFAQAQVVSCVTIENEVGSTAAGTYTFDVYVQTGTGTIGDLYLATSDVQITFAAASFTSPALAKVDNPSPPLGAIQNGYCTFIPTSTDNGGIVDWLSQKTYHDAISTSVTGDLASINLNTISVSSSNILTTIAKIGGTRTTHRLGRFTLTGYTGGSPALALSSSGALRTRIFTYATASPYTATAASLITCTTLPLDWLAFEAEQLPNGNIDLNWATANEFNTNYFEVQHKVPGGTYEVLGSVKSHGNGSQLNEYQYTDFHVANGSHIYRIRQVDIDGAYSHSSEIEVVVYGNSKIALYPNPAKDFVEISLLSSLHGEAHLDIITINGQKIIEQTWNTDFETSPRVSLQGLTEGTYFYRLSISEQVFTGKLIKVN